MTQQLICVQVPFILVINDLHTRISPMTIRSYCFLHDSLKILIYKLNLEKKITKKNHKRRSSNALLVARCWWIELPFNSSLSQGGMDLLLIPHFQSLNNVQLGSSEIRGDLVYRQTAKLG